MFKTMIENMILTTCSDKWYLVASSGGYAGFCPADIASSIELNPYVYYTFHMLPDELQIGALILMYCYTYAMKLLIA